MGHQWGQENQWMKRHLLVDGMDLLPRVLVHPAALRSAGSPPESWPWHMLSSHGCTLFRGI
jgi:hypothetical protein